MLTSRATQHDRTLPRARCQGRGVPSVFTGVTFARVLTVAIAALLVVSANAGATQTVVPPGHAGGNQYVETIPGAGGEDATAPVQGGTIGGGGGKPGGPDRGGPSVTEALGTETAHRFEQAGKAGKRTANLAAATGPSRKAGAAGSYAGATNGQAGSTSGESPLQQILGHLTGAESDDGMGLLMPLLIAMTAILAVGFLLGRRRLARPRD
jgi:hypothetical protein